jgi:NAD-dependent deacetylase
MNKKNIVILTGARISAESGIKTFRDSNGLWENHRVEDVAGPEGFEKDPEMVRRFYNLRRNHMLSDAVPVNCKKIELNLERTAKSYSFDKSIQGRASKIVPSFLKRLYEIS